MPWDPLYRWLRTTVQAQARGGQTGIGSGDGLPTDVEISQAIGLHLSRIYLFRKQQRVSVHTADIICCRMGVHLSFVYGDLYWDYLADRIAFDKIRYDKKMALRKAANQRTVARRTAERDKKRAQQQCA